MSFLSIANVAGNLASGAVKKVIGEDRYRAIRSKGPVAISLFQGFSPIPTILPLIAVKIAIFVTVLVLLMYYVGPGLAIFGAYLAQALIVAGGTYLYIEWWLSRVGVN